MKELREHRKGLIERLDATTREFRSACEAFDAPFAGIGAGGVFSRSHSTCWR